MRSFKVRIFTNYSIENTSKFLGRSIEEFSNQNIEIIFNRSGKADLVLVMNAVTTPRWVMVPDGMLIKILQEPIVSKSLRYLFTYHHSKIYDQILTHTPSLNDSRQVLSIPLLGSFVDPTEIAICSDYQKSQNLSVIASTLATFPGHKVRMIFIEELLSRFPDLNLHTYGRGRNRELVEKIEGLIDYRYSVAIENSRSKSYITEKFVDCIIAGCIPLYYGAPNVAEYFPADSYIDLPVMNSEECFGIISGLTDAEYARRIPSLIEARSLIREKYSVGALIIDRIDKIRKSHSSRNRFVYLFRFDGLVCLLQKIGITVFIKDIRIKMVSNRRRICKY